MVISKFRFTTKTPYRQPRVVYGYDNMHWPTYQREFLNTDWTPLFTKDISPQKAWSFFQTTLDDFMQRAIPTKKACGKGSRLYYNMMTRNEMYYTFSNISHISTQTIQ